MKAVDLVRQSLRRQELQEVTKVIHPAERDPRWLPWSTRAAVLGWSLCEAAGTAVSYPPDLLVQDQPGAHEELPELVRVDALGVVLPQVQRVPESIYRLLRKQVSPSMEAKVEPPRRDPLRPVPLGVRERHADLDDPRQIDIALERLVIVIGVVTEGPRRPGDDAGELRVHGDVLVGLRHVPHPHDLLLEVVVPHLLRSPLLPLGGCALGVVVVGVCLMVHSSATRKWL
mmetsp:Transcript_2353/g.7136  ORF Transcript_2353/g.7136 Transcript_2353/m.7136 type:complete len:229 (+) Transcript_2353:364-1050(+)